MIHVVSLSGGETSTGPLPVAVMDEFGKENCAFIFCDTGAEHDDTYRFIRDAKKSLGIEIICLKAVMPEGKGVTWMEVSTDEIGRDYFAWNQITSRYGNPYMPGGKFCTQQMKGEVFKRYCDNKFGIGSYYTWIGYRHEEGNRIWGKDASLVLGKFGLNNIEKTDFYLECLSNESAAIDSLFPSLICDEVEEKQRKTIAKALRTIRSKNFRFMPEVCNYQKPDVIAWFSDKDYSLEIEEHKTNCLFCIEKPHGTLMLTIKDCPIEAREFLSIVERDDLPVKVKRSGDIRNQQKMYRQGLSFRDLYDKAQELSRDEILEISRLGKKLARKNLCSSGECSPFGDVHDDGQQSLF